MKQRKKVIGAVFLCITANFIALLAVTFAWFNASRSADDQAAGHVINPGDAQIELILHPVTDISLDETRYTFTDFRAGENKELPQYDQYQIDIGEYKCALLLEFHFIEGTYSGDVYTSFDITSTASWTLDSSNYLSNAIKFSYATVSDGVATLSSNAWVSFVTMNLDSNQIPTSFNSKEETITLGSAVISEEVPSLYVVMVYNMDSVFYLCDNSEEDFITYEDDITYIFN